MSQTLQFENIGNVCAAFRLKNFFVTDNKYLFLAPQDNFCRRCFLRRYFTQMNAANISRVDDALLHFARQLDAHAIRDGLWRVYSVAGQKLERAFSLMPYEDCPVCAKPTAVDCTQAKVAYDGLLDRQTEPDLQALRDQVFSFGFARIQISSDKIGLADLAYDGLLGGQHQASTVFRMVAPDGRYVDESAMGMSSDKGLAELKSIMEYLERYAFALQLCRFRTPEYDDRIIDCHLALYRDPVSGAERSHIRGQACWGIDLSTREVRPIPLAFLFNQGRLGSIRPTSSGFAAHVDFRKSLCNSILEIVERDAFIRFWYDPRRAFGFEADDQLQTEIDGVVSILRKAAGNDTLRSRCFVLQSPLGLPVVMVTIASQDHARPPALCFGCGAGFDLSSASKAALNELRNNAINLVKAITYFDGFLHRVFTNRIESIPDRMGFYSTAAPRAKLRFLDDENPLVEGVVEDMRVPGLEMLTDRFRRAGFDIYGLDCTPRCFQDRNVFVTRAFSPQLYPLQFDREDAINLMPGPSSAQGDLPHFFL